MGAGLGSVASDDFGNARVELVGAPESQSPVAESFETAFDRSLESVEAPIRLYLANFSLLVYHPNLDSLFFSSRAAARIDGRRRVLTTPNSAERNDVRRG